ncbi:hypothetical protein G6F24_017248 [Rhizopus arrhizus]|nr:hypothetical protein G6F24_017248 [Rhizopus arrhizus]
MPRRAGFTLRAGTAMTAHHREQREGAGRDRSGPVPAAAATCCAQHPPGGPPLGDSAHPAAGAGPAVRQPLAGRHRCAVARGRGPAAAGRRPAGRGSADRPRAHAARGTARAPGARARLPAR